MLVKDILDFVELDIYLPDNLLNEDVGDVTPKEYAKRKDKYIIRFKDSTFQIAINLNNFEEYFVMTETFEKTMDNYTSYDMDGNLQYIT